MAIGYERRMLVRLKESLPAKFSYTEQKAKSKSFLQGHVVNLSPRGACLKLDGGSADAIGKTQKGAKISFQLELPSSDATIAIHSEIAWVNVPTKEIGLYFSNIRPGDAVQIAKYIENKCVEEGYVFNKGLLIASSGKESEVLQELLVMWSKVIHLDAVALLLHTKNKPHVLIRPKCPIGPVFQNNMIEQMLRALNTFTAKSFEVADVEVACDNTEIQSDAQVADKLCAFFNVPLIAHNETIGIINVSSASADALSNPEMKAIYTLSHQAANNIERMRGLTLTAENKLHAAIDSMIEGVIMFDAGGAIDLYNPAVRHIFSAYDKASLAERMKEIGVTEMISQMRDGSTDAINRSMHVVEPEERDFNAIITTVKDDRGKIIGFTAVIRDITREKEIERMKAEFISTVSHELRTPLSIIKEGVSLVSDEITGKVNEKQKEVLATAQNNIKRLARIIDDLLDISKLESERYQLEKEELDLHKLIVSVVDDFLPQAAEKKIALKCASAKGAVTARVDKGRIEQVMVNLLSNAIKFTDENGTVEVKVIDRSDEVEVHVKDSGIGISPNNLAHVFDKFRQFGRVDGPGAKGTGLGTTICKNIIEMHGGTISVNSELGEGADFYFVIPKSHGISKKEEA